MTTFCVAEEPERLLSVKLIIIDHVPDDSSDTGTLKPWHVEEFAVGWTPLVFVTVREPLLKVSVQLPVLTTAPMSERTCSVVSLWFADVIVTDTVFTVPPVVAAGAAG